MNGLHPAVVENFPAALASTYRRVGREGAIEPQGESIEVDKMEHPTVRVQADGLRDVSVTEGGCTDRRRKQGRRQRCLPTVCRRESASDGHVDCSRRINSGPDAGTSVTSGNGD